MLSLKSTCSTSDRSDTIDTIATIAQSECSITASSIIQGAPPQLTHFCRRLIANSHRPTRVVSCRPVWIDCNWQKYKARIIDTDSTVKSSVHLSHLISSDLILSNLVSSELSACIVIGRSHGELGRFTVFAVSAANHGALTVEMRWTLPRAQCPSFVDDYAIFNSSETVQHSALKSYLTYSNYTYNGTNSI